VQWISKPLQIGDPIPWRHLASDVRVRVSLAEIDPRKVAEVVRRLRHKNNASATHFFALCPKPIV